MKRKDRAKASAYKDELDELYGGEEAPLKDAPRTFYGLSDDEIVVNQKVFKDIGLL